MKMLGIRRLVFFMLLILTALTDDAHTRVMIKACNSHEDCYEDNICTEGICHSCLNCGLLFRDGPPCVSDFKECGSCLKGYEDFPVTDFSAVIKPCELIENKTQSQECSNDGECSSDSYCHEKLCVKCFDCNLYNRLSPTKSCAKEPKDCSSCLNGFYEVPVTTETNTKPCQKITFDSVEEVDLKQFFNSSSSFVLIFMILLEVLIFVVFILKRNSGKSKQFVVRIPNFSPNPPPYSVSNLQNIQEPQPEPEPEVDEESSFFTFVQEEKQQTNTAKVFRRPQAPYYSVDDDDFEELHGGSDAEEEEDNSGGFTSRIQLEDRRCSCSFSNCTEVDSATMPSTQNDVVNESDGASTSTASLTETQATDANSTMDTVIEENSSSLEESMSQEEPIQQ